MIELTKEDRAAYEAWAQAEPRGWSMRRWSGGDYYTAWAQAGWSAWQAGLAAGIERALQVVAVDVLGGTANEHRAVVAFRDERIAAIRALIDASPQS
jgi:hypothetical protein